MFAITVELLTARYVATAHNDRDRVEWPPHPARLFSALVAAWADGEPQSDEGESERRALEWLERQAAPDVLASATEHAGKRTVVTVFVPVNDVGLIAAPDREKLDEAEAALALTTDAKARERAKKTVARLEEKLALDTRKAVAVPTKFAKTDPAAADQLVSDRRARQPRTFPSASPECATFAFLWNDAEPHAEVRRRLESLLSRVVRLGHSSSFVRASVASSREVSDLRARTACFRPDPVLGDIVLRWVSPGQADQLVRAHALHRETEPRVLAAHPCRYTTRQPQSASALPRTAFDDDFIVLARTSGPRLPITSVVGVARQLRRALMSCADEPIHEMLSGHAADGRPSEHPHLAVVPLPRVVGPYADGAILGIGLVLPREIADEARRAVMRAIGKLEAAGKADGDFVENPTMTLVLGDAGNLELRQVAWGEDSRATLQSRTWCRSSRRWASATPIALDRNPGDLHDVDPQKRRAAFDEAKRLVVEAVQRVGLPAPVEIDVVRSCVVAGSAKPRAYPRFPADRSRPQRVLVHARLVFGSPVSGPIMLGAGRYHGLGLFLPVDGGHDE